MRKKAALAILGLALCLSIAFMTSSTASINPEIPGIITGKWQYTTHGTTKGQIRFDGITAGQIFDPRIGTGTFGGGAWTIEQNQMNSPITFAPGSMPAGSTDARIWIYFYKTGGGWMFKGQVLWNRDQRMLHLFEGRKL